MKRLLTLVLASMVVMLSACKNNSEGDAMKTGDQFMKAFAAADFDQMRSMVTGDAAKDLKQEIADIENDADMQEVMKYRDVEYTYDGMRSHVKGDEAKLYYSINDKGMVKQLTDTYDGEDFEEMKAFIEGVSKYFVVLDLQKVGGKWLVDDIDAEYDFD